MPGLSLVSYVTDYVICSVVIALLRPSVTSLFHFSVNTRTKNPSKYIYIFHVPCINQTYNLKKKQQIHMQMYFYYIVITDWFTEQSALSFTSMCYNSTLCIVGHAVAQLVEPLCYKPEGRGFDSRWCHWNFSLT